MRSGWPELVIGDILVAPFVAYAAAAFILYLLLRPLLGLIRLEALVDNPPLAQACLLVIVLFALIEVL